MKRIIPLLLLTACAPRLQVAAQDHYVQTQTIADMCRDDDTCPDHLRSLLDEAAKQARCIYRITKWRKCGSPED